MKSAKMRRGIEEGFRFGWPASKSLFVISVMIIALSLNQPVDSWRLFSRSETRLPGTSPSPPAPSTVQSPSSAASRRLAPISAAVVNPQQQQQPQQSNNRQQQQVSPSELPKLASQPTGSSLIGNQSKTESELIIPKQPQQQQQQQRRASSETDPRNASSPLELHSEVHQQVVNKSISLNPQATSSPSLAGKILDELIGRSNSTNSSAASDKLANAMHHHLLLLKPKRLPAESAALKAEQAILNQHSSAHHAHTYGPNSLTTTKDFSSHFFDSSSTPSNGRDSTFTSILDNLKSGISSRSSIVKAMSDNKLAHTISTVGKTIGGNKYVAGAAAASALAALGLTMTKLLSPYIFSGGYSKLGSDPMMSSGSMLSPSFTPDSYLMNSPDVNQPFGGSHLTGAQLGVLNPSVSILPPPTGFTYSTDLANYNPTNYNAGLSQQQAFYPARQPTATNGEMYLKYTPASSAWPNTPNRFQPIRTGKPNSPVSSDTSEGQYTNFFNQQGMNSAESVSPLSGESIGSYSGFVPIQSSSSSRQPINEMNSEQQANSFNQQTYLAVPYLASGTPHRAGSVSLRMDETTRARLSEQLEKRQRQPIVQPLIEFEAGEQAPAEASKWLFAPSKQVDPIISSEESRRAESSQAGKSSGQLDVDSGAGGDYHYDTSSNVGEQQLQQGQKMALEKAVTTLPRYWQIRPNSAQVQLISRTPSGTGQEVSQNGISEGVSSSLERQPPNQTSNLQPMIVAQEQQQSEMTPPEPANGQQKQFELQRRVSRTPSQSSVKLDSSLPTPIENKMMERVAKVEASKTGSQIEDQLSEWRAGSQQAFELRTPNLIRLAERNGDNEENTNNNNDNNDGDSISGAGDKDNAIIRLIGHTNTNRPKGLAAIDYQLAVESSS